MGSQAIQFGGVVEKFFRTVFQDSSGLIGFAFRKEEEWKSRYFNYPAELSSAISTCVEADSKGWDCYFVPSLLRRQSKSKDSFAESNVVWVDYDGDNKVVWDPEPSALVHTSDNRYHAYWTLDIPETDPVALEQINKALCEKHEGDNSGWDRTQLLRVPDTLSKKRQQPVTVSSLNELKYEAGSFPKLQCQPKKGAGEVSKRPS